MAVFLSEFKEGFGYFHILSTIFDQGFKFFFPEPLNRQKSVSAFLGPQGFLTQVIQALRGEFPVYTVNGDVKTKWMARWGKRTGGQEKRPGEMACPE